MKKLSLLLSAVLAVSVLSGCSTLRKIWKSDATQSAIAADVQKIAGTDAIAANTASLADRVGVLEDQARLTYGLVGAIAKAQGITATDARDWAAQQDAPAPEEEEAPADAENPDAIDFAGLAWKFGSFDGSKAKLDSPRLSHLKASAKGISYKWDTGLAGWGLANADAGALACLFVERSDGSIVGGKFDWVSTSRSSRGLENVFGGYNGWTLEGVPNPCTVYYVVVDKAGRRRSNVVSATWQR